MKQTINVTILGQDYTLKASEESGYVEKIAAQVDKEIDSVIRASGASHLKGAVLAAMNISDQLYKEQQAADELRSQMKERGEEIAKLQMEISRQKQEIFKIKNKNKQTKIPDC